MRALIPYTIVAIVLAGNAQGEVHVEGTPAEVRELLKEVPGTVTLYSEAWSDLDATQAVLSITTKSSDASIELAFHKNSNSSKRVSEALGKAGIDAAQIRRTPFATLPGATSSSTRQKVYHVERSFNVTVSGDRDFDRVCRAIGHLDNTRIERVEYIFPTKDEVDRAVLKKAMAQIKAKEKLYEDEFGVKLRVKNINDGQEWPHPRASENVLRNLPKTPSILSSSAPSSQTGSTPRMRVRSVLSVEYLVLAP